MRIKLVVVFIVAVAAVAAAVRPAPAAPTAPSAAKPNIVQTAAKAGQFKTLIALAKQAGLAGILSTRTLTVFAPTDAAFAKVPKATLTALGKNRAQLRRVLLYHVVAGRVPASKVVTLTEATTLAGPKVAIAVESGTVMVGDAKVAKADVMARNGVIHVIDKVLIPPA